MTTKVKYKNAGSSTTSSVDNVRRKEVHIRVPLIILGLHSNVLATAELTDGHAWLSASRDGNVTNYGLWPDNHPRIIAMGLSDPKKSDIRIGMEESQTSKVDRYYKLTVKQAAILEVKLKENVSWRYTNTCASWASETALAVTGEDVNANDTLDFETPRQLTKSIAKLEKVRPTSTGNPKGIPDNVNVATSNN